MLDVYGPLCLNKHLLTCLLILLECTLKQDLARFNPEIVAPHMVVF